MEFMYSGSCGASIGIMRVSRRPWEDGISLKPFLNKTMLRTFITLPNHPSLGFVISSDSPHPSCHFDALDCDTVLGICEPEKILHVIVCKFRSFS